MFGLGLQELICLSFLATPVVGVIVLVLVLNQKKKDED